MQTQALPTLTYTRPSTVPCDHWLRQIRASELHKDRTAKTMQYKTWIDLTKKRGYPRSTTLKTLDAALKAYQKNTGTIQQLRTAFDTWNATKPGFVQTMRNRKLDQQGLGPVERLWRYIRNEEGTFA